MTTGSLLGGRYQVGELLGYGGMAEVHRGRDLRLGRDVAIKTLRNDLARDATFQLRFRREAQNAAALNHPAIVAVYDTGEEHGPHGEELPYIVMEYVNGHTLKEVLTAEGRLTPRRAMELTAEICSALDFSHRHGIIHRDIKPGNVMLTQTGQVKVMDFGIARALASGASTMTQTSAVIGTAQYLSPEQARGESVDARSDVYATGCVLFELLCGHPPFVGDNPVSVAYQHVREDPRPPSTSNQAVPPDVDAVVLKALAKNPLNRYQSAGEMRADLMRATAGRPVSAPPILTEAQMTAMLPQSTHPARSQPAPGREVAQAARRQRRKGSVGVIAALVTLAVLAVAAVATGLWMENSKTVAVPELRNKTQQDAVNELAANNLNGAVRKTVTTGCKIGVVTDQDPAPGAEVREGSEVKYDYCSGPAKTKVPSRLQGQPFDKVEAALREAKLTVNKQMVNSDLPENQVISVDPAEGAEVNEGATVTVKVSKNNQSEVPDVVGWDIQEAYNKVSNAGFTVVKAPVSVSDPRQANKVTRTSPSSGSKASKDTKVTLYYGQYLAPSTPSSATPSNSSSASPPSGG